MAEPRKWDFAKSSSPYPYSQWLYNIQGQFSKQTNGLLLVNPLTNSSYAATQW